METRETVKSEIIKLLDNFDDYYLLVTAAFIKRLAEETKKRKALCTIADQSTMQRA